MKELSLLIPFFHHQAPFFDTQVVNEMMCFMIFCVSIISSFRFLNGSCLLFTSFPSYVYRLCLQ